MRIFFSRVFRTSVNILLDTIFPKICISCNREGTHLCEDCLALVTLNTAKSPLSRYSSLSGLFAAASYEDFPVKKAIQYFKYQPFLKDLSQSLATLIIAHLSLLDKPPRFFSQEVKNEYLLCPIPLSKHRLRWRGFNHARELAKELSQRLSIPLLEEGVLIKTKHTLPQVELEENARTLNVLGVFRVEKKEKIRNKKILLVDDVFTTGATMEEAAKTLREAGAKEVWGIVIARG